MKLFCAREGSRCHDLKKTASNLIGTYGAYAKNTLCVANAARNFVLSL